MCLRDDLVPLDLIASDNAFYSSGFSFSHTLPLILTCFAVVSVWICSHGVPLRDHKEGIQVMGYFTPSTPREITQFLDQVTKNAMKRTVIPIDRFLW